jgi:excisionase family DNA binding protein
MSAIMETMGRMLTTSEAAERLGISRRRVNALINAGQLPARKFNYAWMIDENELEAFEAGWDRRTGRPRKLGIDTR